METNEFLSNYYLSLTVCIILGSILVMAVTGVWGAIFKIIDDFISIVTAIITATAGLFFALFFIFNHKSCNFSDLFFVMFIHLAVSMFGGVIISMIIWEIVSYYRKKKK